MASSSSSTPMASTVTNPSSYDVFLSFRGEDTRNSFTDHLFEALKRAGINPFRDNDEIKRGQQLTPEIERGIEESRASVVVLSKNYASSTWCLDELWLILEQRRHCNHLVLPVFYHVDPSDVRKQINTFEIQVRSSGRWTDDNVNRWKSALREVADLSGFHISADSGSETKFLAEIVDEIYNKVDLKLLSLPLNLTGIKTRAVDINTWLKQPDAEVLAICGMGGSGKTTLAMYIINSNRRKFENISFVENIGSRCKEPHDLLQLQEQVLQDILGGKNRKIPSVSRGTCKIEEALQIKKAFIVLDDIDKEDQLIALLGKNKINRESKIIITTRVYRDGWFDSRSWRCQEYNIELLNDDESLELLSLHAFGSKIPMEGFKELAVQAIQYCAGNPLALEVLGSNLSKENTISLWKSELSLLEKDFHPRIQAVLIRSYNSLPYSVRELFLHIACFFIGKDVDYVVKILERDYFAELGIKMLTKKYLLSVSPNKKLTMHRLVQEMGRIIVHQESPRDPGKRSRLWRNKDSYDVLDRGNGSRNVEGLALDMQMIREEKYAFKGSDLTTESFKKMDNLKLLQLNDVQLIGSYENFSEDLRWLCWLGFHLRTIPSDLFIWNLVAIDMSYSKLEVFEVPIVLHSLQILNLKDSHNLEEIRNISRLPNLETLVLWNCHSLVHVCETIGCLKSLALLNMTGCENLYKKEGISRHVGLASTSRGGSMQQPSFSLPHSLERLFLKDCDLECSDYFPLSFSFQSYLQYLNLGNSLFEFLPDYNHLKNLRVLDLSFCSRLKQILCLPSTLAELYTYYCESLEKVTFQSHRFTLQEFGYEGCINLFEIEGYIKLVPIAKLDETDLEHLKWLKVYQNHELCLAGDDELTIGRSGHVQMLYEFSIMSTSLPDVKDPNMMPEYTSETPSLSFDVPLCPKNRRLKGINVTFKYTISDEEDWAWFAKISTTNGVEIMYNPHVFGKPASGEVAIWLSYWPIGNMLNFGDKVSVSIAVMSGLEVRECGASLVYTDDEVANETLKNNMDWIEILGGDLSGFQLSTGAYYLCRRDFFEIMEVGRLTPGWFRILVGDTINHTEVRGWRKTGRPQQLNPSFTELKFVRCIIHGPETEQIYKIAQMSKSSFIDKTMELTSSTVGEAVKFANTSEFSDAAMKAVDTDMPKPSVIDETTEFTSQFNDLAAKALDMDMLMLEDVDETMEFTSSSREETMKPAIKSQFNVPTTKATDMDTHMSDASDIDETMEFITSSVKEPMKSVRSQFKDLGTKAVDMDIGRPMSEALVDDKVMMEISRSLRETSQSFITPQVNELATKVEEETGLAQPKLLTIIKEDPANTSSTSVPKKLKLKFTNKISSPVVTGAYLLSENQTPIEIVLVDALTEQMVNIGIEATAKLEIVVLHAGGDDDGGSSMVENFQERIVGKNKGMPILKGHTFVQLKDGIGFIGTVSFIHSALWTKSGRYRLGARPVDAALMTSVKEAWTEAFLLKDRRSMMHLTANKAVEMGMHDETMDSDITSQHSDSARKATDTDMDMDMDMMSEASDVDETMAFTTS